MKPSQFLEDNERDDEMPREFALSGLPANPEIQLSNGSFTTR